MRDLLLRRTESRLFTEKWIDEHPTVLNMASKLVKTFERKENDGYPDIHRLQPRIATADVNQVIEEFDFKQNIKGAVMHKLFDVECTQFKANKKGYRAYAKLQRIDDPQPNRFPGRQKDPRQDRHLNRFPTLSHFEFDVRPRNSSPRFTLT